MRGRGESRLTFHRVGVSTKRSGAVRFPTVFVTHHYKQMRSKSSGTKILPWKN